MSLIDVLTAHGDAIIIAIGVAAFGAIPGSIAAIGTWLNGRAAARNAIAIAEMHACLDQHDADGMGHDVVQLPRHVTALLGG